MTLDLTRPLPNDPSNEGAIRRFLMGLPGVDEVGVAQRVAELASRSIKADAKKWALHQIMAMIDLTTLEGRDTRGKVRPMWEKAARPDQTLIAELCATAAKDLKRVIRSETKILDWTSAGGPEGLLAFTELKTVWHPEGLWP